MKNLLQKLQIDDVNPGACTGMGEWITDPSGKRVASYNPTTNDPIAEVIQTTDSLYDQVVAQAGKAFETWRMIPAPKCGLLIRDLGQVLREIQEPLGELVTLETGKVRAEGIGEVQEMIDICDFALGLSRQL